MRWRSARCSTVAVAVMLAAAACTGSPEVPPSDPASTGPTSEIEAPVGLEAAGDVEGRSVTFTFEPVPDADGYLLDLSTERGPARPPVRVEPEDCDDRCRVVLTATTVTDATSATVATVVGGRRSGPTDPLAVPPIDVPAPPPPEAGATVVVTRLADGALVVETVDVEPNEVQAMLRATLAEDDVVSVGLGLTGTWDQTDDEADRELPEGLGRWYLEAFDVDALPASRGEGVIVAVIDTGADLSHPVFDGADVGIGANVRTPEDRPQDHGTGTAALIVGQPGSRVPGIAPNATVRVYDVFGGEDSFETGDVGRAIIQAVDDGAQVINLSLAASCTNVGPATFDCPGGLQAAVDHAEANDVVVVASAGNDGDGASWCRGGDNPLDLPSNADHWPAKYDTVIAVGGTNRNGEKWDCSNDKGYVDVLAPADSIFVPTLDSGYQFSSGTSHASPLVAGLIATVLAERPDLTPGQIRDLLRRATDENGRLVPAAAMVSLGLRGDLEIVDLATRSQVVPFEAVIEYLDGHPARSYAQVHDSGFTTNVRSFDLWAKVGGASSTGVIADGLLFIEGDGTVTGTGWLRRPPAGLGISSTTSSGGTVTAEYRQLTQGFSTSCPWSYRDEAANRITPTFEWAWDVPVAVQGRIVDDRAPTVEIRIDLGNDPPPGESDRRLPDVTVLRDDLGECPGNLPEGTTFVNPIDTYEEVLGKRDRVFEETETLLELMVAEPGLVAEAPLGPRASRQATITGDVRVDLAIGDAVGPD